MPVHDREGKDLATIAPPVDVEQIVPPRELARQRRWVLGIVSSSHTINHINSSTLPLLYAAMMPALGFGYAELGLMQAVNQFIANSMQALYGVLVQYARRGVILGLGNLAMGVSTMLMAGMHGFSQLLMLRALNGVGSSPQHVVGATMLSTWFGDARGRALGLHASAGQLGQFLAIPLVAGLLLIFDWRVILLIVSVPSLVLGVAFLMTRDAVTVAPTHSRAARAKAGLAAYAACLKNRDLMLVTMIMTVGAAGRGGGINNTYLVPHLTFDLGIPLALATSLLMILQAGGLVAPIMWGYLSDWLPRKLIMQASLFLAALTTVWLGQHAELTPALIANFAIYGLFVNARQAITQAMVGDYAGPDLQDAAFSLYFTIGLVSGPIWTVIMGALMQTHGFTIATEVIALSYIAGMLLLIPLRIRPKVAAPSRDDDAERARPGV